MTESVHVCLEECCRGKEGRPGQSCEQVHDGVGVQGGAPVVQCEIGGGSVCMVRFSSGGRGSLLPQLELETQVLQTNTFIYHFNYFQRWIMYSIKLEFNGFHLLNKLIFVKL